MLLNKRLPLYLLSIWLIFFLIPNISNALPYQPLTNVFLETQYNNKDSKENSEDVNWKIVPGTDQKGYFLRFLYNSHDYCKIYIENNELHKSSIKLFNSSDRLIHHSFGAFIPISGFKIPFRMIDADALKQNNDHFKIVQTAGGRNFSNLFNLQMEIVTIKEAIENQWLSPDFNPDDTENESIKLFLYTVRSEDGTFLFKQLWQQNDTWWLYEETQKEKSWRR
jgi:hypothetical protein